jgi:hypothetical protein
VTDFELLVDRARRILEERLEALGVRRDGLSVTVDEIRVDYNAMPAEDLVWYLRHRGHYDAALRQLESKQGKPMSEAFARFGRTVISGVKPPRKQKGRPELLIDLIGSAVDALKEISPNNTTRNPATDVHETICDAIARAATKCGKFMTYDQVVERYKQYRRR